MSSGREHGHGRGAALALSRQGEATRAGLSLRVGAVLSLVLGLAVPAAKAQATPELRFGTVRWSQTGPRAITFKIETAWTPLCCGRETTAKATDTLICEPKDTEPRACRAGYPPHVIGSVLRMRTPDHTNTSNRWLFGDESVTGLTNGSALTGMRVVEDRTWADSEQATPRDDGRAYIKTYTEVTHEYPAHGTYTAALTGCCRTWDKLVNHRGYGWNLSATVVVDSLWEPITGTPPNKGGPHSPELHYVPEVAVLSTCIHLSIHIYIDV